MQIIYNARGSLYVSPAPLEKDLIKEKFDIDQFDIIWNLASELAHYAEWEQKYASLVLLGNVKDYRSPHDEVAFLNQLEQVVECLKKGGRVLVHCLGGHGRTGTAVALILNRLEGFSVQECLKIAREQCQGPEVDEQITIVKDHCNR